MCGNVVLNRSRSHICEFDFPLPSRFYCGQLKTSGKRENTNKSHSVGITADIPHVNVDDSFNPKQLVHFLAVSLPGN